MTKTRNIVLVSLLALGAALGAVWWLWYGTDSPNVSAQAILDNACEQIADQQNFDFTSVRTMPVERPEEWGGKSTIVVGSDVRISGEDFHVTYTESGDFMGEAIAVNGVVYIRDDSTNMQWELDEDEDGFNARDYLTTLLGLLGSDDRDPESPGSTLCTDTIGAVGVVDEEVEPGVHHLRIEEDAVGATGPVGNVDGTFSWPGFDTVQDYWVDADNGLLLKTKVIYTFAGEPEWTGEFTTEISGVGEPNVIEIPAL